MKLFRYICGFDERYGAAIDAEDAYERRTEIDSNYHFLPVRIEEVTLEGYEIIVSPTSDSIEDENDPFRDLSIDDMQSWLDIRGVKYHHKAGLEKLRELCLATLSEV